MRMLYPEDGGAIAGTAARAVVAGPHQRGRRMFHEGRRNGRVDLAGASVEFVGRDRPAARIEPVFEGVQGRPHLGRRRRAVSGALGPRGSDQIATARRTHGLGESGRQRRRSHSVPDRMERQDRDFDQAARSKVAHHVLDRIRIRLDPWRPVQAIEIGFERQAGLRVHRLDQRPTPGLPELILVVDPGVPGKHAPGARLLL